MCRRPMLESVLPQQTAPARATDASMPSAPTPATSSAPGIALASAGAGLALIVHAVVPAVSPLLVAILCGAVLSNAAGLRGGLPEALAPGLHVASRRFLRLGIVLLGLQLVIGDVLGLGWPVVAGAAVVVMGGLGATLCAGRLLGVPPSQSLLIACGFSICGAAAVAGADGVLRKRNGEETAAAVALVVIFGTAMIAAQPASFFMTMLSRASCSDRLVSNTDATMSRSDSVHSEARSTWSYRSLNSPSNSLDGCQCPVSRSRITPATTSRMGSTARRNRTSALRSANTRCCTSRV